MNTEVRAPGEKFDIEEHSLSHYIDASQLGSRAVGNDNRMTKGNESPERRRSSISTAHVESSLVDPSNEYAIFAYDQFAAFCADLLLIKPVIDDTVTSFATNVLTIIASPTFDLDMQELKRRIEQLLPTASSVTDEGPKYKYCRGAKLAWLDFEQLYNMAERVVNCSKAGSGLTVVDEDGGEEEDESIETRDQTRRMSVKGDVQYIHQPVTTQITMRQTREDAYPNFVEHNREDMPSDMQYDKDITPFDSEDENI